MAEPINLDERLENIASKESNNDLVLSSSAETESADTEIETDSSEEENVESNESSNEEVQEDENITEGSAEPLEDGEKPLAAEFGEAETPTDDTPAEPSEYKFKDDFIKKVVEYYEQNGTLTPFLEATSTDYDALSDVEVLKLKFEKDNSDLSPKSRQRLFEKELEKYNLDSYDEDDQQMGEDLLKRDAAKLRNSLKSEQQEFINSVQPSSQQSQEPQISEEELNAQREQSRQIIQKGVANVVKNNFIKLDVNGEGLNYQVSNTNNIVDYALDSSKFLATFAKDGQVDWNKWTQVVAFAENPTQFMSELLKQGKSLGRKAMEAELKNVKPSIGNSKEVVETNDYESPFDNPTEFLKSMTITKR